MASFSVIEDLQTKSNPEYLRKAAGLEPKLHRKTVYPNKAMESIETEDVLDFEKEKFTRGQSVVLDFGEHIVGYVSFCAEAVGSHFDAPAYLRLTFAERPLELTENADAYTGWLSKAWIQEEYIHIDVFPSEVRLPRRYAFRYMRIEVIDTSPKFSVRFSNLCCEYVSSMDDQHLQMPRWEDPLLQEIDRVSVKTLKDCAQTVFEDGAKRDRRLWLGDLRLQAQVNYVTFRNYDLVKRCLYLFAGMTFDDGRIGACFFESPEYQVDDTYLMDYALLFGPTLLDYYKASADLDTMRQLYPKAVEQIRICLATMVDERHLVKDQDDAFWCFLDWGDGLNKQAGAQAVLIYSIRSAIKMAEILSDCDTIGHLKKNLNQLSDAAMRNLWDEDQELFISGEARQVSWASQVWMVLAGVLRPEENRRLMRRTIEINPEYRMVTPYMYHHYVQALLSCGEDALALQVLKDYWGGMVKAGADTFWEIYNPENPKESPYGSVMLNSYCHAWSCTPSYFLRTVFL